MSPAPDRYAVLGNPVAHSQSPFIHAEFARQTGQRLDYTRVQCAMDGFAQAVRDFAASGARGCNVTLPFKFEAAQLARQVTARAALAQAANVLCFDPDGWLADNSDGIGLVRDLRDHAGAALAGARVLLIGAGGAAAGVLGPLLEARPAQLHMVNRTADKAAALLRRHAALAAQCGVSLSCGGLHQAGQAYDVVLNASASSLGGVAAPVCERVLRSGTLALDLMYGAAAQPFMAWAAAHGAVPRDGLGMLVEQAAEAFWLWRGVRPETRSVLQRLRLRIDAVR
ncbi:MAG TPA: shikimate dehydrogenase [Rubrivivax sp.]|nr:shikimate dehydrogenase [Rubrivivax sp.]